jgi:hypothetical protein
MSRKFHLDIGGIVCYTLIGERAALTRFRFD